MNHIISSYKIIELYKNGFFPMAKAASSIEVNYYKPEKRFIIPIDTFHISKKLFSDYKKGKFQYRINSNFKLVINLCAKPRKKNQETWINQSIIDTYYNLYKLGFAKSIECYYQKKLVGGLYGLHIGSCFFGESMFSKITNTSKLSLIFLISILIKYKFKLLDSQFYNHHLLQFGAYEILDYDYQLILKKYIDNKCIFPQYHNFQKSISILQSIIHKS